mmetsp:Transcript_9245/g.23145  ORF Transcript_9245/g.23145 Transcript_9245/m.23145 type:complete len:84 (-) Transcript_9245:556-807(-)
MWEQDEGLSVARELAAALQRIEDGTDVSSVDIEVATPLAVEAAAATATASAAAGAALGAAGAAGENGLQKKGSFNAPRPAALV